jgi:hypothetical protein
LPSQKKKQKFGKRHSTSLVIGSTRQCSRRLDLPLQQRRYELATMRAATLRVAMPPQACKVMSLQHPVAVDHHHETHRRSAALWPSTVIVRRRLLSTNLRLSNFRLASCRTTVLHHASCHILILRPIVLKYYAL